LSFRAKLMLASVPLALVPLVFFGWGTRREVSARLDAQYAERVNALADVIEDELIAQSDAISARLDRLADAMAADNRLRVALLEGPSGGSRAYLLDYAERAMPLTGLDVLRIQDEQGRVLSSGHFRNEYDALDAALPTALENARDGAVLATFQTPSGTVLALAGGRELSVGSRSLTLVGGAAVDSTFIDRLAMGTGLSVELRMPGADLPSPATAGPTREVPLPVAAENGIKTATFVVHASDAPLVELQRDVSRQLLWTSGVAAALAMVLAFWVAGGLSRPIEGLAHEAERIDLDRLDVTFASERPDEIGALSRVLERMTHRLRASTTRLRDAERRATTGEIARQVNHDVKNGLIPIRNVVSHLAQLARERPGEMPGVFLERQSTLESSVQHLQSLAANYARLTPTLEKKSCDLNAIARAVVTEANQLRNAAAGSGARVSAELAERLPRVHADPVALRRILDNLVVNAVESLDGGEGGVVVSTRVDRGSHGERVLLGVADEGRGLTAEESARVFDDFYTTKPGGTGLGLSIVRRLVADLGGRIEVESVPGRGTRFTVELPSENGRSQ
jgi:signal transduction histidine kinase